MLGVPSSLIFVQKRCKRQENTTCPCGHSVCCSVLLVACEHFLSCAFPFHKSAHELQLKCEVGNGYLQYTNREDALPPGISSFPSSTSILCSLPVQVSLIDFLFSVVLWLMPSFSYHSLYFHSRVSGTKAGLKFSIHGLASPPFCPIHQLPGLVLVTLALPVLSPSPFPRGGSHF